MLKSKKGGALVNELERVYVEIDIEKFAREGEILILGTPKTFSEIAAENAKEKKGWFSITRDDCLCDSYEKIKGKMGIVFSYLIRMRDSNNQIIYDLKHISEQTKLSQHTIIDTIKYFEEKGMIKRNGNRVMINPGIIHKGDRIREAVLMKIFEKM